MKCDFNNMPISKITPTMRGMSIKSVLNFAYCLVVLQYLVLIIKHRRISFQMYVLGSSLGDLRNPNFLHATYFPLQLALGIHKKSVHLPAR